MPERERALREHIRAIEREARELNPYEAREWLIGKIGAKIGAGENREHEEFEGNLRAATVAGLIGAGSLAAAQGLNNAGHTTAASGLLKLGISAMVPYAYFGWKALRTANDLRKRAYRRAYEQMKGDVQNMEDAELRRLALHAAAARRSTADPELEAWATAIIHAAVEEMLRRRNRG